jgi:hypothetical protein
MQEPARDPPPVVAAFRPAGLRPLDQERAVTELLERLAEIEAHLSRTRARLRSLVRISVAHLVVTIAGFALIFISTRLP